MALDVISFVIRLPAFGNTRNRKTRRLVFVTEGRAMSNHDAGKSHKKALKITEALESALKTKRRSAYT
jgi:hypothetical protein